MIESQLQFIVLAAVFCIIIVLLVVCAKALTVSNKSLAVSNRLLEMNEEALKLSNKILSATNRLLEMHSKFDEDGTPLWYMPRKWGANQVEQTKVLHSIDKNMAALNTNLQGGRVELLK